MRLVFVQQVSSHARYIRRFKQLKNFFKESKIFSFTRKYYKGNEIKFSSLGNVSSKNYFIRIPKLFKAISIIKNDLKNDDIIYTFGMDTFLISWFAVFFSNKKNKIIYEVGDIRKIYTKKTFFRFLFRFLQRRIVKKASLIVVTSKAFVDSYFRDILKVKNTEKFYVLENKPELKKDKMINYSFKGYPIRIGYFGVIRCERSIEILSQILKSNKFSLYLRGIYDNKIIEKYKLYEYKNIIIGDEYKVPNELYEMYNDIDLCWATYPYQKNEKVGNFQWAKTTRYYESLFFSKPLILQKNSQDYKDIKKYNVSVNIDLNDVKGTVKKIESLSPDIILDKIKMFKYINEEKYRYIDEVKILANRLKNK